MNQLALAVDYQPVDNHIRVEQYLPLVKRIAYHLYLRLPASIQIDDLIQAGMLGLLDAVERFDPSVGTSFESYAGLRIRGAILDELRRLEWTPRSVSQKSRLVAAAIRSVENRQGRSASDREIAVEIGVSLDEYHQILLDSAGRQIISLECLLTNEEPMLDSIVAEGVDQSAHIEFDELKQRLALLIGELPEREQLVIALYYVDELNLREIGAVIGVSESRVSQIHSQTLLRLRARIELTGES